MAPMLSVFLDKHNIVAVAHKNICIQDNNAKIKSQRLGSEVTQRVKLVTQERFDPTKL